MLPSTRSFDTLCIELTLRCPLHCVHCSAFASPKRTDFIDENALTAYLSSLPPLREVYLSGGEPFEHPGFFRLIKVAKQASDTVAVYTSGVAFSADAPRPIPTSALRSAASYGLDRFDISFYAADPATHDAVTKTPGSFQSSVATARCLRRYGLPFGVHFVPVGTLEAQLEPVTQLAARLGAIRLHVLALMAHGRAAALVHQTPSPGFVECIQRLRASHIGIELVISSAIRRVLGETAPTSRDLLQPAFLDVNGFLHPGEGLRLPHRDRTLRALP